MDLALWAGVYPLQFVCENVQIFANFCEKFWRVLGEMN